LVTGQSLPEKEIPLLNIIINAIPNGIIYRKDYRTGTTNEDFVKKIARK
jgi:hypothetical protein